MIPVARGMHIELFLVDGEVGGITTADLVSWSGHVLYGPRSKLSELLAREESHRNGVYLLLGDDPEAIESTRCYIGKTEDFSKRFLDHKQKKDWWDRAVLISSSDDSFNEGHWGYIEARLVDIAMRAERATLDDNKQTPQRRKLSEAQKSDVEDFIDKVRLILPVLGVNALKTRKTDFVDNSPIDVVSEDSPIFYLEVPKHGISARAQFSAGEFIMLEGSIVAGGVIGKAYSESTRRAYDALRVRFDKLVSDGSITIDGKNGVLTSDIPFTSPSGAASIAYGRSRNGRVAWTNSNGLTYGEWEERDVTSSDSSGPAAPPSSVGTETRIIDGEEPA